MTFLSQTNHQETHQHARFPSCHGPVLALVYCPANLRWGGGDFIRFKTLLPGRKHTVSYKFALTVDIKVSNQQQNCHLLKRPQRRRGTNQPACNTTMF